MSLHDGSVLVAAAVRASILARAPRRTVAAVAAATVGALHRPDARQPPPSAREPAETQPASTAMPAGTSSEVLVAALREERAAKRRRKKERRRANRSKREGAGKEEGQAFTENTLRRHEMATVRESSRPGGGLDGESNGSCAPPPKRPCITTEEEKCLPPAPVAAEVPESEGHSEQTFLEQHGIVDFERIADTLIAAAFPAAADTIAAARASATASSAPSRSRHGDEQRAAGTSETGRARPRRRAGRNR